MGLLELSATLPCLNCGATAVYEVGGDYYRCHRCGEISTPDFTESATDDEFAWLRDTRKLIRHVASLNDVPFGTRVIVKDRDVGTYALNWDFIKSTNRRWLDWALRCKP